MARVLSKRNVDAGSQTWSCVSSKVRRSAESHEAALAELRAERDESVGALRRAAAYALVELATVAKSPLAAKPELGAEVERLALLLRDKRWRDKEDLLAKVAALVPPSRWKTAPPITAVEDDEPSSADM